MRRVLLLANVLLAATAAADAQDALARVKAQNPVRQPLADAIVRGSVPVPADYAKPVAALVLRKDGKPLPTQVDVFATYPGSEAGFAVGRPAVVQFATRVTLPPGSFTELELAEGEPPPAAECQSGPAISAWLADRGRPPLKVIARDAFGNSYSADTLDPKHLIETRQNGQLVKEMLFQSVLVPAGTAPASARASAPASQPAPLRAFLRVRAYVTLYGGEDYAAVQLLIHNGSIDRPNDNVFYRDISVQIAPPLRAEIARREFSPAALSQEQQLSSGYTAHACPPPHKDGKAYVMPRGGAAVVRMVVFALPAKERARICLEQAPVLVPVPDLKLWSWSNFATARYAANQYPMPLSMGPDALAWLDRRVEKALAGPALGGELVFLRDKEATGPLGHALPAGVAYGGMTGGGGISYVYGVEAAVTGHNGAIHLHTLLADRNWDRQNQHAFYDSDGRPYIHSRHVTGEGDKRQWTVPHDRGGFEVRTSGDPACQAHARVVSEGKMLSAESQRLLKYMDHDDQHLCRAFDAVPAAYLACDMISRDRLVLLGSHATRKLNLFPIAGMGDFGGWGSICGSLRAVRARPHEGTGLDRAHGWLTHALGYAFALSQDKAMRQDALEIARADVELRELAQMPAGNVSLRSANMKAFRGEYDFTTGWEEGAILADGARCLVNMLSSPADQRFADRLKQVYAQVGRWVFTQGWPEQGGGPAFFIGLRKKGEKALLDKPVLESGAGFYIGSPAAWYFELTGEDMFLRKPDLTAAQLPAKLRSGDLGNWSYFYWLLQGGTITQK